jgi:Uma2 family endonuclease
MVAATLSSSDQRFILYNADWQLYDSLLRDMNDRHVFITYNRGRLELMSPSWKHEKRGRRLGLLIWHIADFLNLPIEGGGATTFRRKDMDQGLEPDQCFYVKNAASVRGMDDIDLELLPPPDLAIEIEISRRVLDRIGIYANLKVPELWRDDGARVRFFHLGADGEYREAQRRISFPSVPLAMINELLDIGSQMDEVTWGHEIRRRLAALSTGG